MANLDNLSLNANKRQKFVWLLVFLICSVTYMSWYMSRYCASLFCVGVSRVGSDMDEVETVNSSGDLFVSFTNLGFGVGRHNRSYISNARFDYNGKDVLVFIHIQKTGGSFMEKSLTRGLIEIHCECKKRKNCVCPRHNRKGSWIVCRYTHGGWPCGVHADWTELHTCAPEVMRRHYGSDDGRRFFFATILREPTARYLSEFRHVQRGATWKNALHMCNGRVPTDNELPSCYKGDVWKVSTLQEFVRCPHNLANNRQTRMLADLALTGCYGKSEMTLASRNRIMLESAKRNLKQLSYFALLEYQGESQFIFEKTFGLQFATPLQQYESGYAQEYGKTLTNSDYEIVQTANALDLELYRFAKDLFFQRFQSLKNTFGPINQTIYKFDRKAVTSQDKDRFQNNTRKGRKNKSKKKQKNKNKISLYEKFGVTPS